MFDYLFQFSDEATAKTALGAVGLATSTGFDGSRCLPVKIGLGLVKIGVDLITKLDILVATPATGFWIVVSSPEVSETLWAMPQCVREVDRGRMGSGRAYTTREKAGAAQLKGCTSVTPQWCGIDAGTFPAA